jgi:CBS domain-containing protein
MTHFAMPVERFMTKPVVTVPESARLSEADEILRRAHVSCLAVTGADGRPAGVISRTDLLHHGRVAARVRGRATLLALPDQSVGSIMKRDIVAVAPGDSVHAAAKAMIARRIHRVFVMADGALAGVLSTKDVLVAIAEKRVTTPIAEVMSKPAFTIPVSAPLSLATDRLEKAHVSGLCVIDEDEWPVGTFTQAEALAARELPGETPLEEVMSYAMLCLDVRTPLHRAAAHAHETRARRVLAVESHRVKGVLTGLDFARVAATG